MKAFLLAAGYGTRLSALTKDCPKPLVRTGGVPLICYALALLKEAGVTSIICNLHYLPDQITDFFARNKNFGFEIAYSFEKELLGTGGGLKACENFFAGEKFFMINSDIVTDLNLRSLEKDFQIHGACLALHSVPANEATVSVSGNSIVDFKNALESNIVATYDYMGAALLSSDIFKFLENGFSSVVYTGFTSLIQRSSLGFYKHNGLWLDAGTEESLQMANELFAGKFDFLVLKVKEILGPII